MKLALGLPLLLLALGGCGRRPGLYADHSIHLVTPSASPQTPPRFVGRWAASAAECGDPWVFQAHGLSSGAANCEFDKVETSPAGYAIDGVCRSTMGPKPTRIVITTPNEPRISLLTVSGGPFKDAAALQRCGAP